MRYLLVIEYYRIFFRIKKSKKEPKEGFDNPLIKRYIIGFSLAATIWLISAFMPSLDVRFFLWVIGFLIDFATPITAGRLHSKFAPDTSHLPERMGLFTLIVLGESIVGLVAGMIHQIWNIYSVSVVSLGLCISFSIWLLYFPNVRGSAIDAVRKRSKIGIYYTWLYSHFPLVVGITAIGVGIRHLVSKEQGTLLSIGDLWLVCIAISVFLISQIILQFTSIELDHDHIYRIRRWMLFRIITIAAILLFPIIGNSYATSLFVSFVVLSILAIHIILDFLAHSMKRTL
jgi:low temperature requirement protein LtrA